MHSLTSFPSAENICILNVASPLPAKIRCQASLYHNFKKQSVVCYVNETNVRFQFVSRPNAAINLQLCHREPCLVARSCNLSLPYNLHFKDHVSVRAEVLQMIIGSFTHLTKKHESELDDKDWATEQGLQACKHPEYPSSLCPIIKITRSAKAQSPAHGVLQIWSIWMHSDVKWEERDRQNKWGNTAAKTEGT